MNATAKPLTTAFFQSEESPTAHYDPDRVALLQGIASRGLIPKEAPRTTDAPRREATPPTVNPGIVVSPLPKYEETPRFAHRAIFVALQEWEGWVDEILQDTFTARLQDVTNGSITSEEIAEFPLSDVSEQDRALLAPGAIFRWSIGYIRDRGTKTRASRIVFRRLPVWRRDDLDEARQRAEEIAVDLAQQ